MKRKYKRFLKAAYINYDEDYCSNGGLNNPIPPLSEILAPDTFELTLGHGDLYYWTTFYTSAANYLAPEGVVVYKYHAEGSSLTHTPVEDRIINKGQGVVLKSPTGSVTLTKTYSKSSDDYSDNSLLGTDYRIPNPGNAYVLGYKQTHGIGFYRLSDTGKITANKAYLILTPVNYLSQWKIVGNSEVHDNEIWSCGEYSATDGKYHIFIQPQGGSIVDIALTEPLRKVNYVADTIEFPSDTEGKALVTRNLGSVDLGTLTYQAYGIPSTQKKKYTARIVPNCKPYGSPFLYANILCAKYDTRPVDQINDQFVGIANWSLKSDVARRVVIYDETYNEKGQEDALKLSLQGVELIYELETPTTELINVPQIAEAESYTCVTIPGSKALSWSEFITDKEQMYAYGVQWDKNESNPDCTRIGNMYLHRADKLPVLNAMRGCLLNDNGEVVQYLSDLDWKNASLLDGSQGQVMIEIPDFYWKFSEDANGIQSVMLSMVEIEGYKKVNKMYVSAYEAALDRTNSKLASVKNTSIQYRGGDNNSGYDGTYRSQLGMAVSKKTLADFRNYARARKQGSVEWNCNTYLTQKILCWLFVVEYATRYSQKYYDGTLTQEGFHKGGLGYGVSSLGSSDWSARNGSNPVVPIGVTDVLGNGTGEISYDIVGTDNQTVLYTVTVPRYRGIENPFGHLWKHTDGIRVLKENGICNCYVCNTPSKFNDSDNTDWTSLGPISVDTAFIREVKFGSDGDIICSMNGKTNDEGGGEYFTDRHDAGNDTGMRIVRFGGAAADGVKNGLFAIKSSNAIYFTIPSLGSRLVFIPNAD